MPFQPATSLAPFGTTIFTTMSRLAVEHGAVNLSQGFPDFDGPEFVKEAAIKAIRDGHAQYAPMSGIPSLRRALAERFTASSGVPADPDTHVTVTSGCTEAIAAALLGVCNPGDEVILFEPFYDSYRACVAMTGAAARVVTLHARADPATNIRSFEFDQDELRAAFTPRTKAIVLNTPHNPTAKVFSRAELQLIASLCIQHGVIAITDEVYERLTFDGDRPHIHLASLPGMAERTITLSSLGKTFSLTGWKIGWAIAPPALTQAVRSAHQFLTFATSTPMQHAAVVALQREQEYVAELMTLYRSSRDFLAGALESLGFDVFPCQGTYFIMAGHDRLSGSLPSDPSTSADVAFCMHLTRQIGVAAIPPSAFYINTSLGTPLVRFAFCKKRQTLELAVARLERLRAPLSEP
ncbi:MAG: aminotransferase class I/II-fold pyridoxal phosphate-dependent enzyme [Phycisphaerales bacterium]